MSKLLQIKSFIIPCVNVISTFIRAQVTIVDDQLNRVCGTGPYATFPREVSQKSSTFFEKILSCGQTRLVTDAGRNPVCDGCRRREICLIKAEMGCPIVYEGSIIGVIGVAAFTEEEAGYIIENYERLREFVKYMNLLITDQLQSVEHSQKLQSRLDGLTRTTLEYQIIGNSPRMKDILVLAERIALSDSTVLITLFLFWQKE